MSLRSDRVIKLFDSIASETPVSVRDRARELSGKFLDMRTALPLAPGDVAGSYEVIDVLGSGGQAVVYRAKHRQIGRRVALKVPRREVGDRLLREAQLAARLEHPSIARVEDIQLEGSVPYMVLELCEGGSLEDLLEDHPNGLPIELVSSIAAQVLRALSFAHAAGVVHRDVKPAKILFDKNADAKVADFGIGTMSAADGLSVSVELSQLSLLAGTPLYVAPEQENPQLRVDGRLDGRADLFSFGKVLFQMLTGASPRTIRPPSRLRKGLDPAWDDFVFKLLEERPQDRFPSADATLAFLPVSTERTPPPLAAQARPLVVIAPRDIEPARLPARAETPEQRAARVACQVFAGIYLIGLWCTAAGSFLSWHPLLWNIRAGGFAVAAAFSLAAARRASRAKRPTVASAVGACLGAGLAFVASALCVASSLELDYTWALSGTLFVALPFQALGFMLAWVGYSGLAPREDARPTRRELALQEAGLASLQALLLCLGDLVWNRATEPLAILPVLATLSIFTTWLFVRVFALRRAALREAAPRSLAEPRPGTKPEIAASAILGLVCAIFVVPVLLVTSGLLQPFREWDVSLPPGFFLVGLVLATSLEACAVLCAIHARGAIDRSRGMLRGRGLTMATLVIAILNLLLAVALFLVPAPAPSFDLGGMKLWPWEK